MGNPKKKIMLVLGTRPEVVKLASVVRALEQSSDFEAILVNSGQQLDLVRQMLEVFGLSARHDLALMTAGQSPASLFSRALEGMARLIREEKPDWVLVQGDTGTAAAAATAAFFERVPVGHVEAGLRTHDLMSPWPEEYNRRLIALGARLHFAPTESARANLLAEKVPAASVPVTGNTGIDSLLWMVDRLRGGEGARFQERWSKLRPNRPLLLCTFHRRESFGPPLERIFRAVGELAASGEAEIVLPLHPNPEVQATARRVFAQPCEQLHLVPPLDYREFIWLMDRAKLLLTDSGGVQEEAPTLGRPVVIARDKTERPEAVEAGSSILAGTDQAEILATVRGILGNQARLQSMSQPRPVYGDGEAYRRILDALRSC